MTMKAMLKRHVNKFIICIPALRDAVTNRPTTFKVLNTCRSADEACEALENYEKEGGDYANTIIVPNFPEELNENPPELCPSKVAKMFRVACLLMPGSEVVKKLRIGWVIELLKAKTDFSINICNLEAINIF